jgi:hypothetical protein
LKTVFCGDWSKNGDLMSWQGSASHHKKRLAAGRLQTSFLRLTFATFKSLFLLSLKTVAKLTLCATSGKKIGGDLEVYIVLSTVQILIILYNNLVSSRSTA